MNKFTFVVLAFVSVSFLGCKEKTKPSEPVIGQTIKEMPALTKIEVENAVEALNDALVDPEKSSLEDMTSESSDLRALKRKCPGQGGVYR